MLTMDAVWEIGRLQSVHLEKILWDVAAKNVKISRIEMKVTKYKILRITVIESVHILEVVNLS